MSKNIQLILMGESLGEVGLVAFERVAEALEYADIAREILKEKNMFDLMHNIRNNSDTGQLDKLSRVQLGIDENEWNELDPDEKEEMVESILYTSFGDLFTSNGTVIEYDSFEINEVKLIENGKF